MTLLNIALHMLHMSVIAGNMLGWMWAKWRVACLLLQSATLSVWVGYGLGKGWWGYCPLSDWHWQVKQQMGESGLPSNYISYIALHWLGLKVNDGFVSGMVLGAFSLAVLVNLYLIIHTRLSRVK